MLYAKLDHTGQMSPAQCGVTKDREVLPPPGGERLIAC